MSRQIATEPLTEAAFAPFGDVIDTSGPADLVINRGLCGRWHDRARMDFTDGRAGLSLFLSEPRRLPYVLDLLERHPLGSQAFVPMHQHPFLVIVAPDDDGRPGLPRAFVTRPGQAVNLARGTWHGVLSPLSEPGLFAVIDRIGRGTNLEEHTLDPPWTVTR